MSSHAQACGHFCYCLSILSKAPCHSLVGQQPQCLISAIHLVPWGGVCSLCLPTSYSLSVLTLSHSFSSVDFLPAPPPMKSSWCLFFLPAVTKGFVYSSFLKPYNARRSHSDASVGSQSPTESEHGGSSPRFAQRQNSSGTLTFNPSSMAVSFSSGPCQKQPPDASSQTEFDQGTLSASLNSEGSPSKCPSDPDSPSQHRPWDSGDAVRDLHQPAPALRNSRSPRHPEMAGSSVPGRNGQGRDLVKAGARTALSLDGRHDQPASSEAEGNQVSAPSFHGYCAACGCRWWALRSGRGMPWPGGDAGDGPTDKSLKDLQKLTAVSGQLHSNWPLVADFTGYSVVERLPGVTMKLFTLFQCTDSSIGIKSVWLIYLVSHSSSYISRIQE